MNSKALRSWQLDGSRVLLMNLLRSGWNERYPETLSWGLSEVIFNAQHDDPFL